MTFRYFLKRQNAVPTLLAGTAVLFIYLIIYLL